MIFLLLLFPFLLSACTLTSNIPPPVATTSALGQIIQATPPPTPTPQTTPKKLTYAEINAQYGPCTRLPVLMYHHIQTPDSAQAKKQTGLTVFTDNFRSQMQSLKDKGYSTISPIDLVNFFDSNTTLPSKPVLITLDDGYADNFTDAFPILKDLGLQATIFLATGLMENPDYLTWSQVSEMAANKIFFANHTWSHANAKSKQFSTELATAQTQLNDRNLNSPRIFAYPYGIESNLAISTLTQQNFKLAFSTQSGSIACAKQRFLIPRTRVGNSPHLNL